MVQARDAWASRVAATAGGRKPVCRIVTPNGGLAAYGAAWIRETSHIPHRKVVIGGIPRVYDEAYGPPLLNGKDEPDGLILSTR